MLCYFWCNYALQYFMQTASSTVTLSLPAICLGLLILFIAGWFVGTGSLQNPFLIAGLVVLISIAILFTGVIGSVRIRSDSSARAEIHGADSEVLMRPTRKPAQHSAANSDLDVDST
jgi:hypothetical protein